MAIKNIDAKFFNKTVDDSDIYINSFKLLIDNKYIEIDNDMMLRASQHGNLKILKFLMENCPDKLLSNYTINTRICNIALENNYFDIFIYMMNKPSNNTRHNICFEINENILEKIIKKNNMDILKCLFNNKDRCIDNMELMYTEHSKHQLSKEIAKFAFHIIVLNFAILYCDLEYVEYVCKNVIYFDMKTITNTIKNTKFDCFEFLHNKYKTHEMKCIKSIDYKTLNNKLEYELLNFWHDPTNIFMAAAAQNKTEIAVNYKEYYGKNNCNLNLDICYMAAGRSNFEIFKYFYNIISTSTNIIDNLDLSKKYSFVSNLYFSCHCVYDCNFQESLCALVSMHGNIEFLKYLRNLNFKWNEKTTCYASAHGNYDCFVYAIQNGCPWNSQNSHNSLPDNNKISEYLLVNKMYKGKNIPIYFHNNNYKIININIIRNNYINNQNINSNNQNIDNEKDKCISSDNFILNAKNNLYFNHICKDIFDIIKFYTDPIDWNL